MKKRKVLVKRIVGIILAVDILVWFVGMILMIISKGELDIANTLLIVSSVIVGIPLFLVMFGGIAYIIYFFAKNIFKNTSVIPKIIVWITICGIIILFIGTVISYFDSPNSKYIVNNLKVVNVSDNRIDVDFTEYNYDDYITYTIKKPFFVSIKKDDYIDVRYPVGEPNKMHYVISGEIGIKFIVIGAIMIFIWFYLGVFSLIFSIPYNFFKMNNMKKTKKRKE